MPVVAGVIMFLYMAAVIYGAFVYAPAAEGLGETSRIFFFHVPIAWTAMLAFLTSLVNSVLVLKNHKIDNDIKAEAAARIGLWYTVLATITGAMWAKAAWNMYWNWDPREISIVVLLMIYMAYFGLRSAITDHDKRMRLSAVYAILAAVMSVFLVFVVPRVYMSLHPDTIINKHASSQIGDKRILQVFLASLAGFTALYFWLYSLAVRVERLVKKKEGFDV